MTVSNVDLSVLTPKVNMFILQAIDFFKYQIYLSTANGA